MYVCSGVGCGRLSRCVCGCGWCWMWTARRVAVAWMIIFLFFACGGVGVTCIVEYWDALHRGIGYSGRGMMIFWIFAGILVCVAGGGCIIVVSLIWGIVIEALPAARGSYLICIL